MSGDFDKLTEDEQDDLARAKIKEILAKPELEEGDAGTVAACVAFIGTSKKIADKFAQALLDSAESLITGLCVRCGSDIGKGPVECLICQSIRSVRTFKKVQANSHEDTLEDLPDMELFVHDASEPGLTFTKVEGSEGIDDIEGKPKVRCPEGKEDFDEDNPICRLCRSFKRKWGSRPSRCTWTGWHLVLCPGCGKIVPDTVICISCGVKLEVTVGTDQEIQPDVQDFPGILEPVEPARVPWTAEELEALRNNQNMKPSIIAKYVSILSHRTPEEIEAKLEELK